MTVDGWRPYVGVPLEPDITAVVGANESGKSHLLNAIAIVLTGEGLEKRDFCRYSTLFSVEKGKRRYPEVGATFALSESDSTALHEVGVPLLANGELQVFRRVPGVIEVLSSAGKHVPLNAIQAEAVESRLPYTHKLDTQVDLPDAVSIAALAGQSPLDANRKKRLKLLQFLSHIGATQQIIEGAGALFALLNATEEDDPDARKEAAKQKLGRDLLTKIARIEQSSFIELQDAIAEQREGLVNGLIQEMNKSIARHLNISRWWSQDADFELRVSPREHELVFTIRDRTGTDYSFSERSRGLTYFLSYYVQLRSHERPHDRPEILLMDEPDAYLSALGQQDLLRVLENHARPEDSNRQDQVVYVTHSPFLINRNAGHRVRVVDKGAREEGTRLVKNTTQNHYEPLRTSLGTSVAETAFIGGENLFVEGISDQVMLTAMNARMIRKNTPPSQCLDLNQVTLVPGGTNVPYMLYLARGRDQYKPACAVLLDSDKAGLDAKKAIQHGGARSKPTVPDNLIVMLGEWASAAGAVPADGVIIEEPEDLVPLNLAGIAARQYAKMFLSLSEGEAAALTDDAIEAELTGESYSMWNAVENAFKAAFGTTIGKAGFAKELLAYMAEHESDPIPPDGVAILEENYAKLLRTLADTLREARAREEDSRRDQRVRRIIDDFTSGYPGGASRDVASMMLKRVDAATDDTPEGDVIRAGTAGLRRDYHLDLDPLKNVDDYAEFVSTLTLLPRRAEMTGQGHLAAVAAAASSSGLPTAGTADSDELPGEPARAANAPSLETDTAPVAEALDNGATVSSDAVQDVTGGTESGDGATQTASAADESVPEHAPATDAMGDAAVAASTSEGEGT
jgi:predicted ATPase